MQMDENGIISMVLSSIKQIIPKLCKRDNMIIFLLVAALFKSEIVSFGSNLLNIHHNESNVPITQDEVIEKNMNQYVLNEIILDEVKNVRKSNENIEKMLTPEKAVEHKVYCGINNADIGDWELSVTPDNPLGLKDGDKVVVCNKEYDIHLQTAVFFVKVFRKENQNAPDFYMTEETAHCLGIEKAVIRGRFTVSLQHFVKKI